MFDWNTRNNPLRIIKIRCFAVLYFGLFFLMWGVSTAVAEVGTVADLAVASSYIEQGQDARAVKVLKERTKSQADDHNAWFLLGVAYTNLQQYDDAIRAFQQVSTLQPDLAEPHNNIAVIHNETGDYRAAVQELETAVQKGKGYSIAEENLGDLYVKLALQHYQKALDKNPTPSLLKRYQNLIKGQNMKVMATSEKRQPARNSAVPEKSEKPVQLADAGSSEKVVAEKVVVAKVGEAASGNVGQADADGPVHADIKGHKENSDNRQQILAVVESWQGAWSAQDVPSYFGNYADDFQTLPRFSSIEQWKKYKKRVISNAKFIEVKISDIKAIINESGNKAEISFRQIFRNGKISDDEQKTLVMAKHDGLWKIIREQTLVKENRDMDRLLSQNSGENVLFEVEKKSESSNQIISGKMQSQVWVVNVGSFKSRQEAESSSKKLELPDPYIAYIVTFDDANERWFRLRVGFFKAKMEAEKQARQFSDTLKSPIGWVLHPDDKEVAGVKALP